MPFGAIAGGLAAGIGGSVVSGLLSPGTSGGGSGGSYYIPTGLNTADTNWQTLLTQMMGNQNDISNIGNLFNDSLSQGQQAINNYGQGYQNAANQAGTSYGNLASQMGTQSGLNFGTQQSLLNAGQQVYNMGMDPQNALYNRTAQQLQDQTGATNSMYGLGSSGAGAGVANQAMSNFNIDWQNNELSRALQGLQGYTGAASTAGAYGQFGTAQAQSVPGYQLAAGQTPYQTAAGLAAAPGQLGSTYAGQMEQGPLSSASSIMGNIIPYMNYGQGAQSVPYQAQSAGAGAAGSMVAQGIQGLGNAYQNAGSWGNLFGGTTGSFGGGDFSGAFTSSPYYSGGGNSYGFTM